VQPSFLPNSVGSLTNYSSHRNSPLISTSKNSISSATYTTPSSSTSPKPPRVKRKLLPETPINNNSSEIAVNSIQFVSPNEQTSPQSFTTTEITCGRRISEFTEQEMMIPQDGSNSPNLAENSATDGYCSPHLPPSDSIISNPIISQSSSLEMDTSSDCPTTLPSFNSEVSFLKIQSTINVFSPSLH